MNSTEKEQMKEIIIRGDFEIAGYEGPRIEREFIMDEKKAKWGDEKEFNLSEKALTKEYDIRHLTYKDEAGIFRIKDIKEFIKRLKEFCIKTSSIEGSVLTEDCLTEIDELAGDKLI